MRIKILRLFVLSLLVAGCAGVPAQVRRGQNVDLGQLCMTHDIQWKWDSISQIVTLSSYTKKARALVGSDVVMVGSDKIVLSAPIIRSENSILVPDDFEPRVMALLKAGAAGSVHRFKRIVVDAGHGGKDPGAIGSEGFYEKKVTLDIAQRLKHKLEREGVQVTMTRESDEFLTLGERTEVALKAKADLFISIHANANNSRAIHGLEVYYFGELQPKDLSEDQRLRNEWILFNSLSMQKTDEVKKIVREVLDGYKDAVSKPLAEHVSREVTREVGAKNNGYMEARFHVLRNNFVPSILVEVGYLTNTKEERLLKTSDYRERIARALADSILSYDN